MTGELNLRIEVLAVDGSGDAKRTARLSSLVVQLWGTFVATIDVEWRVHPDAPWLSAGSLTAPGTAVVSDAAYEVRLTTSGYTSGTPEAAFGSFVGG